MKCPKCGNELSGTEVFCPTCGIELNRKQTDVEPIVPATEEQKPQYPMKWYKFIIYFSLFFAAFIDLIDSILYFSGNVYGTDGESKIVYAVFPAMRTVDVLSGVFFLVMTVLTIKTRFDLAKFKRIGVLFLYVLPILNVLYLSLYMIIVFSVTNENVASASNITYIIAAMIMLVINYFYFEKRKELFVN